MALYRRIAHLLLPSTTEKESPLSAAELPWLAGAIVAGGIVGPVLLMVGLSHTEASTASLMLTLEGVATALLAWFVFHENFDRRIAVGMVCLVAGAVILSWSGRPTWSGILGPLAIAGACLAWGIDNNLTRKVSLSDPLQIVELKGLIAGPVNVALALWTGSSIPPLAIIAGGAVVGFLGYGISLALFVRALRDLGTARTGAYFSTAPFFGATAAVVGLGEPITVQLVAAAGDDGRGRLVTCHRASRATSTFTRVRPIRTLIATMNIIDMSMDSTIHQESHIRIGTGTTPWNTAIRTFPTPITNIAIKLFAGNLLLAPGRVADGSRLDGQRRDQGQARHEQQDQHDAPESGLVQLAIKLETKPIAGQEHRQSEPKQADRVPRDRP